MVRPILSTRWIWLLALLLARPAFSAAAAPAADVRAREALAVLKAECFTCHSEEKKKEEKYDKYERLFFVFLFFFFSLSVTIR